MAGLTSSGFDKKTLDEIKSDLEQAILAVFGVVNVQADSVFGQEIGIIAEIASDIWDLADLTYQSQYPNSALGVALDNVAQLNNLTRLAATESSVQCTLEGTEGTVIPVNTQMRQVSTNELFETFVAVTITEDSILKALVSVNTESAAPYTININSPLGNGVYTSNLTTTLVILNDLRDKINLDGYATATVDSVAEQLTIITADNETAFEIQLVTANLDLDEIWSPVICKAVTAGKTPVPANSITTIETPVSGLNSVDNILVGTEGRNTETDDEFRVRRIQSLRVIGAATIPSIAARILQEVDGVTACIVQDNREDITVDGRPPHSFEAIVEFPLGDTVVEQAIADKIWAVGGAGIETVGNITKTIVDSEGNSHLINFSRPTNIAITVNIAFDENTEEILATDYEQAIKDAVVAFSLLEQDSGKDVFVQKYATPIYSIPGVGVLTTFEMNRPAESATSTSIVIASNELAVFSDGDITVIKN